MKSRFSVYLIIGMLSLAGVAAGWSATKEKGKGKGKEKPATSAEVRKMQSDAQKEIDNTRRLISDNEAQVKKNLDALGVLESEMADSRERLKRAEHTADSLQNQIAQLESEIADSEARLELMRREYLKAIKKMRVKGKQHSPMAFIFSSKNFYEAERRMRYLGEFADWRSNQSAEIMKEIALLAERRDALAQARSKHSKALSDSRAEQKNLEDKSEAQQQIVAQLRRDGDALRSHLAQKQAEANALGSRVAQLIADEQRRDDEARAAREKAKKETPKKENPKKEVAPKETPKKEEAPKKDKVKKETSKKEVPKKENPKKDNKKKEKEDSDTSYAEARKRKPKDAKDTPKVDETPKKENPPAVTPPPSPASGFEGQRGALPHPVAGVWKVVGRFGRHALPQMPDVTYDNPGIDVEVAKGADVKAVYQGKVSGVYVLPGYGTVVIVNHGGYYTVYGNLANASVRVGDSVKQGTLVGKAAISDSNPNSGLLHFEVWKNRDKLDPLGWIK